MMTINGRATAACLTSLALAGCMGQAIPAAESITKPTMEAFTQLSTWRPWQSKVQERPKEEERRKEEERLQQPQIARVETTLATEPQPITAPSTKHLQPSSKPQPVPTRLATPRPAAPQPKIIPASAAEASAPLPTAVSCQTFAQPGQRVRMECNPLN
jgi:hypothetical protein